MSPGRNRLPRSALSAGQTSNGEKLYVARVKHDGILDVGKVRLIGTYFEIDTIAPVVDPEGGPGGPWLPT